MKAALSMGLLAFILALPILVSAQDEVLSVSFLIRGVENTTQTIDSVELVEFTKFEAEFLKVFLQKAIILSENLNESELKLVAKGQKDTTIGFEPNFLIPESADIVDTDYETINIPYSHDIKIVEVVHKDKKLLTVDIQPLLCNQDKNCSGFENYLSCPQDCFSGGEDNYCNKVEDGICDKDCLFGDLDCYSYPTATKFSPSLTTDFSKINKSYFDYVRNIKIGIEGLGQIDFQDSYIDVSGANLDKYVTIEKGKIRVQNLPGLNKSATLIFFNTKGDVLKNNLPCTECKVEQKDNNLIVQVENFDSIYTVGKVEKTDFSWWWIVVLVVIVVVVIIAVLFKMRHKM